MEKAIQNATFIPEVVKLLDEGHTVTINLKGVSMRPFLENGRDKALLIKPSSIKVGDPVLAEIGEKRYVLHRVLRISDDGDVVLLGDGNLSEEYCKITDIKGIAIGFYRKGRRKLDKTDCMKWKIYSFLWMSLFPIRRYLLYVYRHIWIKVFPVVT